MDEETIKTQNPKCRLYWCLIEFIDWRYSQTCWYFRPFLWTVAPLRTFSLTSPTPPPLPKVNVQYSVWLWGGGGGMLSCIVDHILQEFNTLFLTRFRTYKITTPPQTKSTVKTTFTDWCLYSSFVHGLHPTTTILFPQLIRGYLRDDVTVILLLGVSFTGFITTAKKSCWRKHMTTQAAETDSFLV